MKTNTFTPSEFIKLKSQGEKYLGNVSIKGKLTSIAQMPLSQQNPFLKKNAYILEDESSSLVCYAKGPELNINHLNLSSFRDSIMRPNQFDLEKDITILINPENGDLAQTVFEEYHRPLNQIYMPPLNKGPLKF